MYLCMLCNPKESQTTSYLFSLPAHKIFWKHYEIIMVFLTKRDKYYTVVYRRSTKCMQCTTNSDKPLYSFPHNKKVVKRGEQNQWDKNNLINVINDMKVIGLTFLSLQNINTWQKSYKVLTTYRGYHAWQQLSAPDQSDSLLSVWWQS